MSKSKLKLDEYEIRIIINALNDLRNKLIQEKRDTSPIDELLLKLVY